MANQIEAILFDVGGTLRHTVGRTREEKLDKIRQIMNRLGIQAPVETFEQQLFARAQAYKKWSELTHKELNEQELWTHWMLPDYPAERVSSLGVELNQLYRESKGVRVTFPESREVIIELFRRGYRLGLVSNTTSSVEVPELLKELEILGCFEAIILSAVEGKRKPDPALLIKAAQQMGVAPGQCAYVGDRVDRDVLAAHKAGFSRAVVFSQSQQPREGVDLAPAAESYDRIENLRGLLDIFPARAAPQPPAVYDASLSSMYAIKNFPTLSDFFEFSRRMGFARVELNHKVTSNMLAGIDPGRCPVSSVHEPCPADISEDELRKRNWLISATDETCRTEGVKSIKRSIDLAKRFGASTVIIHAGQVMPDRDQLEKQLRALIDAGQRDSDAFRAMHARMFALRSESAAAGFAAVRKSLLELLAYAAPKAIRLGIENRYHYLEYPSPDELSRLLQLAGPDQIGFIFDTGHAETLDVLGFYPLESWLERFSDRIIGTHLHDVIRTRDHFAPGLGSIDFSAIAAHLPKDAFRTCEFQTFNTPEQVKVGLERLASHGCIIKLRH